MKNKRSKLNVACRRCGHRSVSTSLGMLEQGQSPGCFCNRAVPWSGTAGHARCFSILAEGCGDQFDASRMDELWWRKNVKNFSSKVDVTCRRWGHRSVSTSLGMLEQGQSPGCFCNRAVPWSGTAGHARCLSILAEGYGDQFDASRMDELWWRKNVKNKRSKLNVACRRCGHRSVSTSLGMLEQGQSPGCFCNRAVPWSGTTGARSLSQHTCRRLW